MEIWKEIPELGVEVSDYGNVREAGVWIRPSMVGKGYLRICLNSETHYIHHLVLRAFVGPRPQGMEVNHRNSVPTDNRLENLEYVTSSQNTLHAVEQGRWPIGERRWNSRLTEDIVREIRQLARQGETTGDIARKFNLNFTTVYHVVRRDNWKHVA